MEIVLIIILVMGFIKAALNDQEASDAKAQAMHDWCQKYKAEQLAHIQAKQAKEWYHE